VIDAARVTSPARADSHDDTDGAMETQMTLISSIDPDKAPSVDDAPPTVGGSNENGGTQTIDPFDPRNLRISQDFAANAPVKKVLTTVPTEKPNKQTFFQSHPNHDYHLLTQCIEVKDGQREVYLVAPHLRGVLAVDVTTKLLVPVITRENNLRIWPINYGDASGRMNSWSESAIEAVKRAENCWVRVVPNMDIGAYDIFEALADLPPPVWPRLTLGEMLKIAFKGRYIDNSEHPVLRRIRGEV
jgi:hypothetical protein